MSMLKCCFFIAILSFYTQNIFAQVRVLFDATKYEMAGNADWVIDADVHNLDIYHGVTTVGGQFGTQSNPQRYPTPAQSSVTSSTVETYWAGAISAWGIDCVKQGYEVETLPYNGAITYGNTQNVQDLSNYKVFVIDEPNAQFTSTEKTAIVQFVKNGGGLFIICDHDGSDRDGDGWDSPAAWNDLLANNTVQSNPFGISFDLSDISQISTNVSAASNDSIIHGPMGNVTSVKWSDGTTMTLNTTANPSVKGVIYTNGSSAGDTHVMAAYARYGKGKVVAIGDSSPPDDGTGDPNDNSLYGSYAGEASGNHRRLIMNMTIWLATVDSTDIHTVVQNLASENVHCSVYPNPATGFVSVRMDKTMDNVAISVYDVAGRLIQSKSYGQLQQDNVIPFSLEKGLYFIKVSGDNFLQTNKVVIY